LGFRGKIIRYALAASGLLLVWLALSLRFGPFVLPAPVEVLRDFFGRLSDPDFLSHALRSLARLSAGLALGFFVAFPLGILMGHSEKIDGFLAPPMFLTYPVPKVLFLPVFLILFGMGDLPKTVVIALATTYQILVVVRDAVRNADPSAAVTFETLWASAGKGGGPGRFLSLARHVLIPEALPAAVSSLRLASGTAVSVLFVAETFATDKGLGYAILDAWGAMDLKRMWSAIIAMSLFGAAFFELANFLEWWLCPWKRKSKRKSKGKAKRQSKGKAKGKTERKSEGKTERKSEGKREEKGDGGESEGGGEESEAE
jgi:NitT/TauT family transport system permease protein